MSEGAFSSLPLSLASDSPSFRPVRVPAAKKVPGIGKSYVINPSALSAIKCKMAAKADRPSTAHIVVAVSAESGVWLCLPCVRTCMMMAAARGFHSARGGLGEVSCT